MKLTVCQTDIIWASPSENEKKIRSIVAGHPGTDLFVLPEMFSTGFATQPDGIAEKAPYPSLALMKEIADANECAIAGSIAIEENGRYYNRFYFVKPNGQVECYDKKHLFTYGGEHRRFCAGSERKVVEWRGVRFLLEICYDLRFPVWSRNRGDYDAIIYVASWPSVRRQAWDALLRARAIENQCFVLGVNRVGSDPTLVYDGGSVILDPWGRTLAVCGDGVEEAVDASIDMDVLNSFRHSFPVSDDSDAFNLI